MADEFGDAMKSVGKSLEDTFSNYSRKEVNISNKTMQIE